MFSCVIYSTLFNAGVMQNHYRVPTPPGKPGFLENSRTWKVLEKYPSKSCIFLVVRMEDMQQ